MHQAFCGKGMQARRTGNRRARVQTIYAIGGLTRIDSLEEIAWLNHVCDRLGLDTMSAGNLSAFTIEALRAGAVDFDIDYNRPD